MLQDANNATKLINRINMTWKMIFAVIQEWTFVECLRNRWISVKKISQSKVMSMSNKIKILVAHSGSIFKYLSAPVK